MTNDVAIEISNTTGQNVNVWIFAQPFSTTDDTSNAWKIYYLGPATTEYTTYPQQSVIAVRELDPSFPPDERITMQAAQEGQTWSFTLTDQFPALALSDIPVPENAIACANSTSKPINVEVWKGGYPIMRSVAIAPSAQVMFAPSSKLWFACGQIQDNGTITSTTLSPNIAEVDLNNLTHLELAITGSDVAEFGWTITKS